MFLRLSVRLTSPESSTNKMETLLFNVFKVGNQAFNVFNLPAHEGSKLNPEAKVRMTAFNLQLPGQG
jgi:hypothetical protein